VGISHNITSPDRGGFQVRVVRDKKEYSRYFSHKLWGNKGKSLQAAVSWREQILAVFGDIKPMPVNKSTGVVGVSKIVKYDKRRGSYSLFYSCHWRKNKKAHTRQFHVGLVDQVTPDEDFHAFRTAVLFRKEYEFFKEIGQEDLFSPEKYALWKTKKVYGQLF
jgi:hypothetical protein